MQEIFRINIATFANFTAIKTPLSTLATIQPQKFPTVSLLNQCDHIDV